MQSSFVHSGLIQATGHGGMDTILTMEHVIDWLMDGDPAIRWQTLRDLTGAPENEWRAERRRTLQAGWGAQFLEHLRLDGTWPPGRWTDTVWTLLTLIDCGLPSDHPPIRSAAERFLERNLTPQRASDEAWLRTRIDLCHLGFWLRIGAYFLGNDARMAEVAHAALRLQLPDGGWNCRTRIDPQTHHSSFHTTLNVLEGLSLAAQTGIISQSVFRQSEDRAAEFMLVHNLYRSDRTGEVIDERFTRLTYPSHWHYTVLRGLDYLRASPAIADVRLADPISVLASRRNARDRWPLDQRIPGTKLFDMEKIGADSRWNTLRAERVFRARARATTS